MRYSGYSREINRLNNLHYTRAAKANDQSSIVAAGLTTQSNYRSYYRTGPEVEKSGSVSKKGLRWCREGRMRIYMFVAMEAAPAVRFR